MVHFEEEGDDSYSSTSSTSSPSFKFTWDIFLSFRGEDTRHNFVHRLREKLLENGIRTFFDDEGLQRGEEIHPSLLTAIEDSAASIAVISENYANSRWCLEELAKILDCGRLLLPVFYKVDPSHVRHQKGPFEEAFISHEQRFGINSDKVLRWKKSMEKAGGIAGWDSRTQEEPELIQSLVKKILKVLSNTPLGVAKYPIGIDSRVQEVLGVLDVKSNGVRVVGFHGMGGIGKTTLAKAVYNKIVTRFEHRSFISNVREIYGKSNGIISLQNKLIHNLFPGDTLSVDEIGRGITKIKEKIHEKRVLIVLDDVDHVQQLVNLACEKEWFHEGSRIIITTRNKEVLVPQLVTKIYEVKELDAPKSLQLFSLHAFGRDNPIETFMHLSKQVVSLTGQLPLALEVLGAYFFDKRRVTEWEDGLEKLRQIRPGNLHDVLKVSFDVLDEQEKCIFLDIACFFVGTGMEREYIIDILKGCGFNAEIAITVLTARSLIKVLHGNTLWMHDQLRDMGRQIILDESLTDFGTRSRLWNHEEIMNVLTHQTGTKLIQGIVLDVEGKKDKEINLHTKAFEPMANLRLLQINHIYLEGDFIHIPSQLKWLQWKACPLETLPSDFRFSELSVLDLTGSKIKQVWDQRLWGQYKMAEKLKVLNLHGCNNLTTTPDFSGYPRLEKLILESCISLVEIHKSIGDVRTLTFLNLKNCSKLVKFPNDVSGLRSLESLILSGCSKLKELPKDLSRMTSLINLVADQTAIEILPKSICHLKRLERLSLNGCTSLKQLPSSIVKLHSLTELSLNHSALEKIPDSIKKLTNLELLSLIGCQSLATIPDSVDMPNSLLELFLDGTSIKNLPEFISYLSRLKHLSVGSCRSLDQLPKSIGTLLSLVELQLDKTSIRKLPDEIGNLSILEKLMMRNCEYLTQLPDEIGNLSCLTTLVLVNNVSITELPESIGQLKKLEVLNVNKCKQLRRLPDSIGKLTCLREFQMEETGVAELPKEFGMLSSLMVLKMAKRPHLEQLQNIEDHTEITDLNSRESPELVVLPDSFSSLSLLYELDARYCKISGIISDGFMKLTSLEDLKLDHNNFCRLPSSLGGLSLLKTLSLSHCKELKSLPQLPSSLSFLDASNCSALETIYDISNLRNLQELRLTNCKNLKDVPGLECLNEVRRLYLSGCTECSSAIRRRLPKVAIKKLQNLSVPGSQIPNWLVQEVPNFSNHKHHKITDIIICVVISLQKHNKDAFRTLPAIVDIQAKILRENEQIFSTTLYLMGVPESNEDQFYLCRYLHYSPLVSLLKEGDKIQVMVRNPQIFQGLQLKKFGIHLVYEDDDDIYADDDDDDDDDNDDDDDDYKAKQSVTKKITTFFNSLEDKSSSAADSGSNDHDSPEPKMLPSNMLSLHFFLGVILVLMLLLAVSFIIE